MNKTISRLLIPYLNKQLFCHITMSASRHKEIKLQMFRQQKMMNKLLHRLDNGKKKMSPAPSARTLAKTDGEDGRSGRSRVSVLNKLFMRHITDMMITGEIAEMVKGRQLEISQVKVAPNFSVVYVMWLSKGGPDEADTEAVLVKVAGILRHELSQLKVIGVVPLIQFVKDNQYAKIIEVERALAKADFGEDFEPTLASSRLKAELTINTKLDPELVEKIKELEKNEEVDEEELIEEPMPPMRQDVLGLDRDRMMGRIERIVQKSPTVRQIVFEGDMDVSGEEQKIQFTKYLKEREITRKRMEQNKKNKIQPICDEVIELQRKPYFVDDDFVYDEFEEYHKVDEYINDDHLQDFTNK